MSIQVLSQDVAIKIAAGEVVERPLSVVKELIENSIDAKSTEIKIIVNKSGRSLIEVSDNGEGITSKDLKIAVQRHATSKIQNLADLDHITSLGFRGEALASMAAVSHFTIQSRVSDEQTGSQVRMEGGKVVSRKAWGGNTGTSIRVENLFFNTPARLNFLKQELTEKRAIIALVQKYAFNYAGIQFILTMDGRKLLQSIGNGNQHQVLNEIFGLETTGQMLKVKYQDGEFLVNGYTSPIGLTRSNRKEISFFVNGRWIIDASLSAALIQAYHTFLMVGRYPLAILELILPLDEVNVNVHPAKSEVRFKNPGFIFSLVQRAVRHALMQSTPPGMELPISIESPQGFRKQDFSWTMVKDTGLPGEMLRQTSAQPVEELNPFHQGEGLNQVPLLRLIGQIAATYLVAEGPDGLYLIDQHAAHERILFEKFNKLPRYERPKQQLLDPLTIDLNPSDFLLLHSQMDVLNHLGFEIEEFGVNSFRLRSVPSLFSQSSPLALIRACVENLDENESPLESDLELKLIGRICKRSAVKGGQVLSHLEQSQLVLDLEQCRSPRTCPHGRPTMIHLSVDLLERQFGRQGRR